MHRHSGQVSNSHTCDLCYGCTNAIIRRGFGLPYTNASTPTQSTFSCLAYLGGSNIRAVDTRCCMVEICALFNPNMKKNPWAFAYCGWKMIESKDENEFNLRNLKILIDNALSIDLYSTKRETRHSSRKDDYGTPQSHGHHRYGHETQNEHQHYQSANASTPRHGAHGRTESRYPDEERYYQKQYAGNGQAHPEDRECRHDKFGRAYYYHARQKRWFYDDKHQGSMYIDSRYCQTYGLWYYLNPRDNSRVYLQ